MSYQTYDIVAYTYQADIVCPACIVHALEERYTLEVSSEGVDVERALADLGALLEVDVLDETSYDSFDFPKVVFRDHLEEPEVCGICAEPIDY